MNPDWAHLPAEIFGLVLARLSVVAAARSAAVCKSWYALTADAAATYKSEAPWIRRESTSDFYSISDDRYYNLDISGLGEELCIGVHEDWMAVACPNKFTTLYNPFSKARTELPLLPRAGLYKMALSSSPDQDPNCQAAVVSLSYRSPVVGFCSVHETESNWNYVYTESRLADIVFYNRSLLGATMEGELKSVNLDSSTVNLLLPAPSEPPIRYWEVRLFVSDGELLMLCSFSERPLHLFRPNWELGLWEMTDSMKGKAIFLSESWNFSLGPPLPNGVLEDAIYFFQPISGHPDVFRLKDRVCMSHGLEKVFAKIGGNQHSYTLDLDCMLIPKLHFRRFFEAT